MFDLSNLRLPSVNKTFLQSIFWLLVFLFLASIFVSARGIYDRFLQKPELRLNVFPIFEDFYEEEVVWLQRAIVVENQGNADAANVLITLSMPGGSVNRVNFDSDERYTILRSTYDDQTLVIEVPRLARGASVRMFIWATYFSHIRTLIEQPQPKVHVAYDGGIAEPRGTPTALEEIKNLGDLIASGFTAIYQRFDNEIGLTSISRTFYSSLPIVGIYNVSLTKVPDDFRAAVTSSIIVSICLWLLLRREWAGLLTALLIGFLFWLYTDFTVNILWLAFALLFATIAALITDNNREALILAGFMSVGFIILFHYTSLEQWTCIDYYNLNIMHLFNCVPVHIPGAIVVGYFIISVYTFTVDL